MRQLLLDENRVLEQFLDVVQVLPALLEALERADGVVQVVALAPELVTGFGQLKTSLDGGAQRSPHVLLETVAGQRRLVGEDVGVFGDAATAALHPLLELEVHVGTGFLGCRYSLRH